MEEETRLAAAKPTNLAQVCLWVFILAAECL